MFKETRALEFVSCCSFIVFYRKPFSTNSPAPLSLLRLFDVYINTTPQVQRIIRQHITTLIRRIGMQSPKLLEIIGNFAPGGETLIIRFLVVLCDTGIVLI